MNHSITLLLLLSAALPSCRFSIDPYSVEASDRVLATREVEPGVRQTYRLRMQFDPTLVVESESQVERAQLGLELDELDKIAAERRGVRPYSGLLVTGVAAGSAAQLGGVQQHDVLLALDEHEAVYLDATRQFAATLRPGQVVTAKVLRGQQTIDVPLRPQQGTELVTERQEVALEAARSAPRPYAGVDLRGIPAAWCERMFGTPRQAVIVTRVEVGAPAWLAGVRPGDIVDTVDGAPVGDVHELMAAIAERGPAEQPMTWGVRRGNDAHSGTLELQDYRDDAGVWIPLVFHLRDGTFADRWSFGPLGLLLSNRNEYVPDTTTRTVQTRNVFQAVLGLFRVESTPRDTEIRLLWFIHFDT